MTEVHPQVARALALHPLIRQEGDEVNRRRELTPPIVRALKDGGFFRMLQPRSIGGMELKPSDFARVTEAIAARRRVLRLGGLPEQRMLDVRRLSRPGRGAGDLRTGRRHPGLGTARRAVRGGAG